MESPVCPHDGTICLLDYIYGGDASLACDSDCHLNEPGNEDLLEYYKRVFPDRYQLFLNAIKLKNETK